DAGQLQLLPEHLRQLIERDLDFADVLARLGAGFAGAITIVLPAADRAAPGSLSLTDAAGTPLPVAGVGGFNVGNGDADVLAPLAADHLPLGDVLSQIVAHLPAHDLLEALEVVIYGARHSVTPRTRRSHGENARVKRSA